MSVYVALFLNAFIAATLLPAMSELTLASLILSGTGAPCFLLVAATAGNVAGSCLNWWLGQRLIKYQDRSWFPFTAEQLERGKHHFAKYGKYSLLFAWLPIIGDPLTLVAGSLRVNFLPFLILVTIGKTVRYGAIVLSISQ